MAQYVWKKTTMEGHNRECSCVTHGKEKNHKRRKPNIMGWRKEGVFEFGAEGMRYD